MQTPLSQGQVQIWKVPLPLPHETIDRLNEWLSSEERERIGRFHFATDRQRYASARGALRTIPAAYLDEHPRALTFAYGPYGKPFLADPDGMQGIEFNLSHCSDMGLIGVTRGRRVGIDVEAIREIPEMDHIVERHFNRDERASIAAAEGPEKARLFLHFWTRREAAAKARGPDLSASLSDLGVPPYPPGVGARFEQVAEGSWSLKDLELDPLHIGAVCAEGDECTPAYCGFDPLLGGLED
jgi:4'-phosphopantetheinyl transferase